MKNTVRVLAVLIAFVLGIISVKAQSISGIVPDTAWQGQSVAVTISGSDLNFVQSTGTTVWLEQGGTSIQSTASSVSSSTVDATINVPISAPVGLYNVVVGDPIQGTVQLNNGFEVITVPAPLGPPALIAPANGSSLSSNPVIFSWSVVQNAVAYQYEIAYDQGFFSMVESGTVTGTNVSLPLGTGSYYWRVRTQNIASNFGAWSTSFQFDMNYGTPQLISIEPDSAFQGESLSVTISGLDLNFDQSTPTILFELENNGTVIPLYVSPSVQFNGNNFEFTGTENFNVPQSTPVGLYDLNYIDPNNQSYSLPQAFEVLPAPPAPDPPALIAPIGGVSLNSIPVMFIWSEPDLTDRYRIQVSSDASFTSIFVDSETSSLSTNENLASGTYYWRVMARNIVGEWGAWSTEEDFTLNGVTSLLDISPDSAHAGLSGLHVNISGINLPFSATTSTTQDLIFEQNSFQFTSQTSTTFSSSQGNAIVDIPLNAPTGYYDVILEDPPLGPWVLPNGFYVHAGNQISGLVYVDLNGNQVYDGGDAPYPYAVVESTPTGFLSMSQSNGVYTGYLPAGSHQLEVDVPYYNSSPASHNANFGGSGSSLSGLDFALQPIAGQRDMRISMNAGNVRTGRNMTLNILIENVGTTAETGQIELTFPVGMSFVSSSNQNYSVNGNMVTVNYVNVLPLEDRQIQLTLFTPLTITAGQTVDFMGTVDDINNDLTPLDNTFLLENVVVNSYDPNIKEVSPLSYIDQSFVDNGEYLYYTVHFQNTGTASAIDVYILDTISDLIEYNTFQFLTSSHDCEVNFLNDRIVEFRFDGINLPDSTSNEEESKGFVSYRVKPIGSLQEEEYILNTAHIYFDFNEAIVTNTTENWIPISVGLSESNADRYSIYPNPNNGVFWIQADRLKEYKVFSSTGQLVTQRSRQLSDKMIIDLDGNDSGVYFIELYAKNGVVRKKLVLIRE